MYLTLSEENNRTRRGFAKKKKESNENQIIQANSSIR